MRFHSQRTGNADDQNEFPNIASWFDHFHAPRWHQSPQPPPRPSSLEFRSIDGSGNNLVNTEFNATGSDLVRLGPANFADGVSTLVDGPNPRVISNVVVGEGDAAVANPEGLSGMMYAWGQFIDHDLDFMRSDGVTRIDIAIPSDDPVLQGTAIPLTRVLIDPSTGQDGQPATAVNAITGWLDASMVYGSDQATADSLRLADGHMKTSAGDNLPIENGMFLAGDIRVQENPSLTALQTLFLREHNYQVDVLHRQHPNWDGERLFQEARAIVTAEIQNITYSEFLPHLLGADAIDPYHGYDATVDPRITEEFAGAAFRFGHSIVSAETERIDEFGAVTGEGLELKDTFGMMPEDFVADGGADGFLRHLASDASQALDARIVDDLRNFLDAPPAELDLAAINIQRGRDLGLGTLNETRAALGLDPYKDFGQLTDDAATAAALQTAFGDIDAVDLWTGGLAEKHAPAALVGETFQTIIAAQFENLRDGDRLWFENQGFDAKTLNAIRQTTLADIIERNTDTDHIQDDVFVFYNRHSGTQGGVGAEEPDAPQLVIGSNGVDTLLGGPQGDVLVAGTGRQTLTGGAGADVFVFGRGVTYATITDFDPSQDRLEFDNLSGFAADHMRIKSVGGDAVLQVGNDHIVLVGAGSMELNPYDLILNV
jgi:Ca2+-binding RTX toxin-like protein